MAYDDDDRDEAEQREQEEAQRDWDSIENDPYSDDEKDNIGDNGEGVDYNGD